MKIKIYCEDKRHPDFIDVSDEDCQIWVENDYRFRLDNAIDKSSVVRRTPQEIMDEDCNKPTFNNNQNETRRHTSFEVVEKKDPEVFSFEDPGFNLVADSEGNIEDEALAEALTHLLPRQRELLHKLFWENYRQTDIAAEEGVSDYVVSKRVKRIYDKLKKDLKKGK